MSTYVRSLSIGGSDVAIILGLSRWRTQAQLYDDLVAGRNDLTERRGPLERGTVLEPFLAGLYQRESGRTLVESDRQWHSEIPFLHASPDRLIVADPVATEASVERMVEQYGPGILEMKCPGWWMTREMKERGVPDYYYAQVQHYLFVTGFQWASFATLDYDAWQPVWKDMPRDEPFIAQMVDAVVAWWERHITAGVRPAEVAADLSAPEAKVWPRSKPGGDAVVRDDAEWTTAVTALRAATEAKTIATRQWEMARDKVKELMGENEVVVGGGVRVVWREGTDVKFDLKAAKAAHPDAIDWAQFTESKVSRDFRPTFR